MYIYICVCVCVCVARAEEGLRRRQGRSEDGGRDRPGGMYIYDI